MLDFSKLAEEKIIEVPVLDGRFQYHSKKYKIFSEEDGWFKVKIEGNSAEISEPVFDFTELEKKNKPVKGYTYNNTIIFHNFDSTKRKWGFELSEEINFNSALTFSAIKAIVWEDKKIYFVSPDYSNFKIFDIKTSFDNDEAINNLKEITPELRTLFLFHEIEREQFRELERQRLELERMELADEERKKREKELMASIPGRLQLTFERSGARMIQYSISGNRIIVDWEMLSARGNMGRHNDHMIQYNSVIDSRTFKVLESGYCMSGDDRRHNITSLVKLAEDYEERGLTHITRR